MITLMTEQVYLPPPQIPPQQSFTFPKPLSYEFRVAEHVDNDGNIFKVGLQVQVWQHDQYGAGSVIYPWTDVQRVKLKDGILQS